MKRHYISQLLLVFPQQLRQPRVPSSLLTAWLCSSGDNNLKGNTMRGWIQTAKEKVKSAAEPLPPTTRHRNTLSRLRDSIVQDITRNINEGDIFHLLNLIGSHESMPKSVRGRWGDMVQSIFSMKECFASLQPQRSTHAAVQRETLVTSLIRLDKDNKI